MMKSLRGRKALCLGTILLFAIALPAGAQAQKVTAPPVEPERTRLIEKIKEINRWGPEAPIVGDMTRRIDEVIAAGEDAEFLIGWGLTRDGQAYRFRWKASGFSFETLSAEAAAQQGFQRMSLAVNRNQRLSEEADPVLQTLTPQEAFARGYRYHIADAVVGEPPGRVHAGEPIRGHLQLKRKPGVTGEVVLSLKVRLPGTLVQLFTYPDVPEGTDEKAIVFEFAWPESLPRQGEIRGVLSVVAQPQAGTAGSEPPASLSNPLSVSLRVVP